MRGPRPLVLFALSILLGGCLAAPAADEADAGAPDAPDDGPATGAEGAPSQAPPRPGDPAPGPNPAAHPDPAPGSIRPTVVIAPVEANGSADERLRVTWTPEAPVAGDVLRILIDAPLRWPEPRCAIHQIGGRDIGLGPHGGGEVASFPASEVDGRYVCERPILDVTSIVVVSVTREEGTRTRLHGPHAIVVAHEGADRIQRVAPFGRFEIAATDDGAPFATAEVEPAFANVGAPAAGPMFAWNVTHAVVLFDAFVPRSANGDPGHHLASWAAPTWTTPLRFEGEIDVTGQLREGAEIMGAPPREGPYMLVAFAVVENDHALAVSEAVVAGFAGCEDGECYVDDG